MTNRAPLILALVLLLLPVLYVGSYFAVVGPRDSTRYIHDSYPDYDGATVTVPRWAPYRCCPQLCEAVFWPLEKLDRQLRPDLWDTTNR